MANYAYKEKGVLSPYIAKMVRTPLGGVECVGVPALHMRSLYLSYGDSMIITIIAVDGGYAIRSMVQGSVFGTYVEAEHSKRMRVFRRLDTAVNVCKSFGVGKVVVEIQ
jgi:hypothetical protein